MLRNDKSKIPVPITSNKLAPTLPFAVEKTNIIRTKPTKSKNGDKLNKFRNWTLFGCFLKTKFFKRIKLK